MSRKRPIELTARIVCGDAADVLRTLPAGIVALTVTSPPYFRQRNYGVSGQIGQESSVGEYLNRIGTVLAELHRVTDDAGVCFFVVGDTFRDKKLLLVPHRIALLADSIGWTVRNDIIWSKTDPAPESPRNRWRSGHEHIIFLTKQPSGYRFNADAVRVPYAAATLRRWGAGQAYGGGKSQGRRDPKDSRMRHGKTFKLNPHGCLPTDVWSLPASNTAVRHYATFSEKLVQPLIKACSDKGDLVLDPFAGSGTACCVAFKLGRRCFGIELNPEYAAAANERLGLAGGKAA